MSMAVCCSYDGALLGVQVESLHGLLRLDSDKMARLMGMGFSEREARLGLRACRGDLDAAALHISQRRQVMRTNRFVFVFTPSSLAPLAPDP